MSIDNAGNTSPMVKLAVPQMPNTPRLPAVVEDRPTVPAARPDARMDDYPTPQRPPWLPRWVRRTDSGEWFVSGRVVDVFMLSVLAGCLIFCLTTALIIEFFPPVSG